MTNYEGKNHKIMKPYFIAFILLSSRFYIFFFLLVIFSFLYYFFQSGGVIGESSKEVFITGNTNIFENIPVVTFFKYGFFIILTIFLIYCLNLFVRYKKEKYIFLEDEGKIIYNYGGILYDGSVEINAKKITQVLLKLPFIEHMIFRTGYLLIKTAGSVNGMIGMRSVKQSREIYEYIQVFMRKNGFELKKKTLVQEAKPHIVGVILETWKYLLSPIIFLLFLYYIFYGDESIRNELTGFFLNYYIYAVILILSFFIFYFLIKYFDLKMRVYQVYDDSLFFSEGFLTKHYSFLPMETISDIGNDQGVISRLLGIHNIVISSEGADNKVYFFNIVNGKKMTENIKYLKENFFIKDDKELNSNISNQSGESNQNPLNNTVSKNSYKDDLITNKGVKYNYDYTEDFVQDKKKILLLNILYIVIIIGIPIAIYNLLISFFVKYKISRTNFEYEYNFFVKRYASFNIDKITKIELVESWLDKICGTCSIYVHSIGGGSILKLSNIKKTKNLFENVLSKIGYTKSGEEKNIDISFSIFNFIKQNLYVFLFFVIFALCLFFFGNYMKNEMQEIYTFNPDIIKQYATFFVLGIFLFIFLIYLIFSYIYYSKIFYYHKISNYFIISNIGIVVHKSIYSNIYDIKFLNAKKYPLTKTGTLTFGVAGTTLIADKKNPSNKIIFSSNIKIPFVSKVFNFIDMFDEKLINSPKKDLEKINTENIYRQSFLNSLFSRVIIFVFLSAFFLFKDDLKGEFSEKLIHIYFFILGIFILLFIINFIYIKTKKYILENEKISAYEGIIFRDKKTILFKKINNIENNQGFVNKIFSNGNIGILTKGSMFVDISILNVSRYKEFFDKINKKISGN